MRADFLLRTLCTSMQKSPSRSEFDMIEIVEQKFRLMQSPACIVKAVAEDKSSDDPPPVAVQPKNRSTSSASVYARTPQKTPVLPSRPPTPKDAEEYEVECIQDKRVRRNGSVEYFVKWVGYPESENLWLEADTLTNARTLVRKYEQAVQEKQQQSKRASKETDAKIPQTPRPPLKFSFPKGPYDPLGTEVAVKRLPTAQKPPVNRPYKTIPSPEIMPSTNGKEAKYSFPVIPGSSQPGSPDGQGSSSSRTKQVSNPIARTSTGTFPSSGAAVVQLAMQVPSGSGSDAQSDVMHEDVRPENSDLQNRKRKAHVEAQNRLKSHAALEFRPRLNPDGSSRRAKSRKTLSGQSDSSSDTDSNVPTRSLTSDGGEQVPSKSVCIRVTKNGTSGMEDGKLVVNILAFKPAELRIRTLSDVEFLINYADHQQEYVPYSTCIEYIPDHVAEYLARVPVLWLSGSP